MIILGCGSATETVRELVKSTGCKVVEGMEGAERRSDSERITREVYEGFEQRIKAAVRQGIMTRAEAGEKLAGFRRRMEMAERGKRGITVEEGEAKPEDVERRLIEMRKMIRDEGERSDREYPDWEGIKRRIEGAVKSGRITREEADEKYREIRERMAEQRVR